jgi:hypothetical protein
MRYFRELELDNLDILIEKSLAHVKMLYDVYNGKQTWNMLDYPQLLVACPELETAFLKYGLICNYAAIIMISKSGYYPPPHVDGKKFATARINLPLLNCKNTRTEFFSNVQVRSSDVHGLSYYVAINTDYVLEDYFELSKATVLRVKEPHRVTVPNNNPVPRIALTLGFDKDPIFLLDDNVSIV